MDYSNQSALVVRRTLRAPGVDPGELSAVAVTVYPAAEGTPKEKQRVSAQIVQFPDGKRVAAEINSYGAEAHRIKDAFMRLRLRREAEGNTLPFPAFTVKFAGGQTISIEEMPHSEADGYIRHTDYYDDKANLPNPRLATIGVENDATWHFTRFPLSLIFGSWMSHITPSYKIPRAITSTIMGYTPLLNGISGDPDSINRKSTHAVRVDPLMYGDTGASKDGAAKDASKTKDKRPSEYGMGDIPSSNVGNVYFFDYVEHRLVLSLTAITRYRFPTADGKLDVERDKAAQRVLIALAILGISATIEEGYRLRSGCDLVPSGDNASRTMLVDRRTGKLSDIDIPTLEEAEAEYREAVQSAISHGLEFAKPITATPNKLLESLMSKHDKNAKASELVSA
jgi:CRISPR-associated protein Csb1